MFSNLQQFVNDANEFLWGPFALIFLSLVAIFLTIGTRFVHIRKFFTILKKTLVDSFSSDQKEAEEDSEGTLSSAQSLFTALASTIGMGSIVGVASALISGGPGALLWMWVAAILGMIIKYSEIILIILFRKKDEDGEYVGGPALYIKDGLGWKFLGEFLVILMILVVLTSNMIQSNVVVQNIDAIFSFDMPALVPTLALIILTGIVLVGGVTRIGNAAEKIIPFMSAIYLVGGLIVIFVNYSNIWPAIQQVFQGFYSPVALGGGVVGYGISQASQYGIARGFFVSGAGQSVFTVSHAPAKVKNPVEQAVFGVTEVFLVTIICTITGLSILTSGMFDPSASAATLTTEAFNASIPGLGYLVSISIVLFSFTTVIGLGYIGESQLTTIMSANRAKWFKYIYLIFTFIGGVGGLSQMWEFTDFFLAIVMYINLVVMILLSKHIFKTSNLYWQEEINYRK